MNSNIIEIENKGELTSVLEGNENVIIDFYATWCMPCKQLSPVLDVISNENPNVKICKVNVDNNSALTIEYNISSIPAIFFMKGGNRVYKTKGFLSKGEIKKLIVQHF